MVGWYHQLDGHEFKQAPGDGKGQGSLVCCSPWGRKESDTTEGLNRKSECAGGHTQWQEKEDRSILNNLERDPSQPSLYHHRC